MLKHQKRFWVILSRGLDRGTLDFFLSKTLVPVKEIFLVKDACGDTVVLRKMSKATIERLGGVNKKEYFAFVMSQTERVVHHGWNLKATKYISNAEGEEQP